MREATGVKSPGNWFAADVDVPTDVAVLNFVLQYWEHYDNNDGQDYKAAVHFDSAGRFVAISQHLYLLLLWPQLVN